VKDHPLVASAIGSFIGGTAATVAGGLILAALLR
jgi:hypothetical protein